MAALSAVAPVLTKTPVVSTGKVANTNSMMVWQPHGNKYVFRSVFLLRGVPRGGCSFSNAAFFLATRHAPDRAATTGATRGSRLATAPIVHRCRVRVFPTDASVTGPRNTPRGPDPGRYRGRSRPRVEGLIRDLGKGFGVSNSGGRRG